MQVVDLVAEERDHGEGSVEGVAWFGAPPGAGDGVGTEQAGCFGVAVSCLLDIGGQVRGGVVQSDLLKSGIDCRGRGWPLFDLAM